jgi:hypothetical protein
VVIGKLPGSPYPCVPGDVSTGTLCYYGAAQGPARGARLLRYLDGATKYCVLFVSFRIALAHTLTSPPHIYETYLDEEGEGADEDPGAVQTRRLGN